MPESCTRIINLRYAEGSRGSSSNPDLFNKQEFEQLKRTSLRKGSLFVDRAFPPDSNSLGAVPGMQQWQQQRVKWLRPADIAKGMGYRGQVTFLTEGASRLDFGQGQIANCWFLAAVGSLTLHKELLVQVVPLNQSFEDYAGIFHFRFWRFGRWVDVVIDDFLPTYQNQLLSVNSTVGNEYWVPLLEKAYAKLCGSYADMHAGNPSEAFKDFCGGVFKTYTLRNQHTGSHDDELWGCMTRASDCKSMIGCGTFAAEGQTNTISRTGLVDWHAYAVTGVAEVNRNGSMVRLIRLLNPWGYQEWHGDWSDKSDLWNQVSPQDQAKCIKKDDGEFWMNLEDYCHNFNYMSICCENPNFLDGDLTCQWNCMSYNGSWIAGKNAGGGINESTYDTNQQFRIKVKPVEGKNKGTNNLLLSVMRKPAANRNELSGTFVGFSVFKLPAGASAGNLPNDYLRNNLVRQSHFTRDREMMELFKVDPGEYVVIPSTLYPDRSEQFLLTVYTKAGVKADGHENGDHEGHGDHDVKPVTPKPTTEQNGEETSDTAKMFKKYCDRNKELSIPQLRRLLNDSLLNGKEDGFNQTACRSLVAFSNSENIQRNVDYPTFVKIWEKCVDYKKLFHRFDADSSETLSAFETVRAADSRGINVDVNTVIMQTFMHTGFFNEVPLEGFVPLMLQLESNYSNNSTDQNGINSFDYYETTYEIEDGYSTITVYM